jgi:hypothetical protein
MRRLEVSKPAGIERDNWTAVVEAFNGFFDGIGGTVRETSDEIEFDAGFTGLAIHRNGTSRSFMPLHDLRARWEAIEFDDAAHEVTLVGADATYTYRVPPQLFG